MNSRYNVDVKLTEVASSTNNSTYNTTNNPTNPYDILYKVVVIGESSVGKTVLVNRYKNPGNDPLPPFVPTIGIDFRVVDLNVDGLRIRAQLWDTAGHERFRTMTKNFFRGAKGILLLFDVSNRRSFLLVEYWVKCLKSYDLEGEEIFMIGNKKDLVDEREVSFDEGKSLARSFGMKYFETSAKTGENVKETIENLIYNMKDNNHPFLNEMSGDALYRGTDTVNLKTLTNWYNLRSRCCQSSDEEKK